MYFGLLVMVCSILQKILEAVAQITPSTADDELASKTAQYLGVLTSLLNSISIITPKK